MLQNYLLNPSFFYTILINHYLILFTEDIQLPYFEQTLFLFYKINIKLG